MAFDELREDYAGTPLREQDCSGDPIEQFQRWFDQALAAEIPMANAMTLATVDKVGHPHARIVLLKELDAEGFVFFTNYESRKGRELIACPHAALLFWWHPLARQIRIEGTVSKIEPAESDAYFEARPRGSNLVAIASAQSRKVASRDELEGEIARVTAERTGAALERPVHGGGYRLVPSRLEFWQGRPDRSHDRLEYLRDPKGHWTIARLFP